MSGSLKLGLILVFGAIAAVLVINIARSLMGLVLPIAIVGGVGLILYSLISRKALGGSGRNYLP
ncbi:MAG: hypothetical protein KF784_01025 [Fimbriimonadaceae bacterium]|nr:hypothetical protein [Fimbriimonadaceae bacterium]